MEEEALVVFGRILQVGLEGVAVRATRSVSTVAELIIARRPNTLAKIVSPNLKPKKKSESLKKQSRESFEALGVYLVSFEDSWKDCCRHTKIDAESVGSDKWLRAENVDGPIGMTAANASSVRAALEARWGARLTVEGEIRWMSKLKK